MLTEHAHSLSHLLQWQCRQGWGQGLDGPRLAPALQQSSLPPAQGPQGRPDQNPCQSITLSPGVIAPLPQGNGKLWPPQVKAQTVSPRETACLLLTSIPCADPYAHKRTPGNISKCARDLRAAVPPRSYQDLASQSLPTRCSPAQNVLHLLSKRIDQSTLCKAKSILLTLVGLI